MSIPNHWQLKKLGEMCDEAGLFCDGDWVESKDQDPNGQVRLIQLADIGTGYFKNKSNRFLTLQRAKELGCTFLQEGDLLIARMPDPLGRSCIFPFDYKDSFVTVVDVCILRVDERIVVKKFLNYIINSPNIRQEINKLQSGSTRKRISRMNLSSIAFPLPPLSEQRAIVAKIEMLLSDLDNGIANLKEAKTKLEIYRQAVLKKAFQGELTGGKINVPTVMLGSVISIVSGSTPQGLSDVKGTGDIQFYKVSDMNLSGNEKEMRRSNTSLNNNDLNSLKIKTYPKGTVIFPKRGGAIHTNKKRILFKEASFDLNLMGLVPNNNYLSGYLYYYMMSIDLSVICDGSNVPQINTKNIYPLEFPSCSVDEQKKINEAIETRFSVADKLEEGIDESLVKAEALRQSILKQAFEGKLLSDEELGRVFCEAEREKK